MASTGSTHTADTGTAPAPVRTKLDNYVRVRRGPAAFFGYVSYAGALLGIGRLHAAGASLALQWLAGVYGALLAATVAVLATRPQAADNVSYTVFRRTASAEFALLVLVATLCHRRAIAALRRELTRVDSSLDPVGEHGPATGMVRRGVLWVVGNLLYYVLEYCLVALYGGERLELGTLVLYVPLLAHDLEQLYYTSLLRGIYLRLRLLRAYLVHALGQGGAPTTAAAPPFDIAALHRLYERLHRCAELLNVTMSFPMFVMLISSGVSTTFLLKNFVSVLQFTDANAVTTVPVMYGALRCVKYALAVFVPCLYSGLTAAQVRALRTAVQDALDDKLLVQERGARRRLKALARLMRESPVEYALWGVVALDMSLPLSYISLCTTYLVIVIQFSKFID